MAYQTVNSREIIVPELGIALHVHSIEIPHGLAEISDGHHTEDVDRQLVEICREVFRLGPSQVISFCEWSRTTVQVQKTLDLLLPAHHIDSAHTDARSSVASMAGTFRTPGNYLEGLIRNGLLVPRQQRMTNAGLRWFEKAITDDQIAPELFANLAVGGVFEVSFSSWYIINQLLFPQRYPSAEVARQEIPGFEIPVAGSKVIKAITIQNFEKVCYGAGAMVIGETALTTASALQHGQAPAVAAVLGGAFASLVFISVGSLSRYLEEYLKSKSSLGEAPGSTASKKGRRAAAA